MPDITARAFLDPTRNGRALFIRMVMLKLKKLFSVAILALAACLLASLFPAFAVEAHASYYDEESDKTIIETSYYFREIDVKIDVRKDKTFAITERLRVGFLYDDYNTGIIRDIQRISQTTRMINGKSETGEKYVTRISDVSVTIDGAPAKVTQSLYSNGNFHSIKMQKQDESYFPKIEDQKDESQYHVFELSYVYDMSEDKAAGYDDFTFDILGYAMAFTQYFKAEINFPDRLEKSAVTFRTNGKKTWAPDEQDGEWIKIDGKQITVNAKPMLENKGYTVQVLLPEGYFTAAEKPFVWYYWLLVAVAALAVIATGFLFFKFRTQRGVEPLEFYPPAGMRPARFSAVWYGRMRRKDIPAVVLLWAKDGYVSLERDGKRDVLITKLKNLPDSAGAAERKYFRALFMPIFSSKYGDAEVYSSREMRKGRYYKKGSALHSAVSSMQIEADAPDPYAKGRTLAMAGMVILSLIPMLMMLVYLCIFQETGLPLFFAAFMAAGTAVGYLEHDRMDTPLIWIFPIAFMAMPLFAVYLIFYLPAYDFIGLLWIALGWWAFAFCLSFFMKKRTPEAQKEYEKMRGFRKFVLTAELSRIEMLLKDYPDYYNDIIPYCLVMGISKKVEKRFAPLQLALPEWANGVPVTALSHCLSHSVGSSSGGGGGGGGGGGSSGGGGGGGGSRGC